VWVIRKEPTISAFVFFERPTILVGRSFAETITNAQNFTAWRLQLRNFATIGLKR
jgi:hypothetical protein